MTDWADNKARQEVDEWVANMLGSFNQLGMYVELRSRFASALRAAKQEGRDEAFAEAAEAAGFEVSLAPTAIRALSKEDK